MACFLIAVSAFRPASALQNSLQITGKEKDCEIGAAAAYDTQEAYLITKTRKIIAASNRALREAEAILKRR